MASSNRHWPSMFKSKPCTNTHHHQWQHDMNNNNSTNTSSLLSSNACNKASYTSGCEERIPEPKPRWNPRPEQIRILESIFNSGMVNPPRDEIRKIRAQLQEYGQVGDANVFYWFQNRKSRSKHKQRQLQSKQAQSAQQPHPSSSPLTSITTTIMTPPTSSSSNSSDKSSPTSFTSKNLMDVSNSSPSPTASVNQQSFLQAQSEFLAEPFFFQPNTHQGSTTTNFTQGFCFPDVMATVSHVDQSVVAPCGHSLFFNDLQVNMNHHEIPRKVNDLERKKLQEEQFIFPLTTASTTPIPSSTTQVQGIGISGGGGIYATKSTVFINDVAFEVPVGPFNIKGSFGEDAVLFHSSGQPVFVDEWGFTLQPLQHGAFYFLLRAAASPSMAHDTTIHLS